MFVSVGRGLALGNGHPCRNFQFPTHNWRNIKKDRRKKNSHMHMYPQNRRSISFYVYHRPTTTTTKKSFEKFCVYNLNHWRENGFGYKKTKQQPTSGTTFGLVCRALPHSTTTTNFPIFINIIALSNENYFIATKRTKRPHEPHGYSPLRTSQPCQFLDQLLLSQFI